MDKQIFFKHYEVKAHVSIDQASSFHLLVPVVSNSNDPHALTYAAKVAAANNGHIHLYHITDLLDLPSFENPFAVRRWLREVRAQAAIHLKMIKGIIEKWGAKVFSSDSSVGDTSFLLQQKMTDLIPDLIIVGENSLDGGVLSKLTKRAPCPVLIVPKTARQSMIYIGAHQKRAKIDSLNLLHKPIEKWSLN